MIAAARSRRWTVALLPAMVVLCTPLGAVAVKPKQVLLLHSFGRDFAPYDAIVAAFRTELAKGSSEPIAVYDASLDAEQVSESDDPQPLLALLRHRFAGGPPDLVVTIGPPAAAFYLQNRDKVFPGTPLVISALDERLVQRSALRAGDAVVALHQYLPDLVNNILRVLPDTQTIAVVIGDTPLERYWLAEGRREFAQFANRVSFQWLNDLSLEQMRQRVAALPAHSAVLYSLLVDDAAGVPQQRGASFASLFEVSAAPIFSLYETELGHGVVGGPYHSQQRGGALTAAAALRLLSRRIVADPVIQLLDYETPVYDWRELKRWGVDLARLPAGSEIRFQPPSLWQEHSALIIAAISIVVVQAVLLIGLVWQRVHRRRAEEEAQALSGRLISAHEDERGWIARELHDDITQRLVGAAIDAAKLPAGDLPPSDIGARRSVSDTLMQLSEDIHDLSYRLHPSVLQDLGLVEALKAECARVARSESVRVDLEAEKLPPSLPRDVALCIYRIAQEALRNIGRHAKASIVQVSLASKDGGLLLAVTDNGRGFEPGVQTRPSLGHASMRERIRVLGGRLEIRSTPGRGTTIVAWVPIPEAAS
jgi:signal transduction histidine kinase